MALAAASLLAIKAMRSRSLSRSGAVAGFIVGFLLVLTGWRGMVLFCFTAYVPDPETLAMVNVVLGDHARFEYRMARMKSCQVRI